MDKRKQKSIERQREKRLKASMSLPMNKNYLLALDENAKHKYKTAEKIMEYKKNGIDEIQDLMRNISAYIDNIRHSQALKVRYKEQLDSGKIMETHSKLNRPLTEPELYAQYVATNINSFNDLSSIRDIISNRLMASISDDLFTAELFDKYVTKVSDIVEGMGFELFPTGMEIIWPE